MENGRPDGKNSPFMRGLGFVGVVGWTVVTPTVLGALAGRWLDAHSPAKHSWTLSLLVGGLFFGIFAAWRWIEKQQSEILKNGGKKNG